MLRTLLLLLLALLPPPRAGAAGAGVGALVAKALRGEGDGEVGGARWDVRARATVAAGVAGGAALPRGVLVAARGDDEGEARRVARAVCCALAGAAGGECGAQARAAACLAPPGRVMLPAGEAATALLFGGEGWDGAQGEQGAAAAAVLFVPLGDDEAATAAVAAAAAIIFDGEPVAGSEEACATIESATVELRVGGGGGGDAAVEVVSHSQACATTQAASSQSRWRVATAKQELIGEGFHRTLHVSASLTPPASRNAEGEAHDRACDLAFVHVLPPRYYADPYELARGRGGGGTFRGLTAARVATDAELERAAAFSAPVMLEVTLTAADLQTQESLGIAAAAQLPLHARYAPPHGAPRLEAMVGPAEVSPPAVLVRCGGGAFAPAEWSPDSADVEGLAVPWDVPRGRLAHHRTVEATTAAVIVLSAVAVAVAAQGIAHRHATAAHAHAA